MSHRAIEYLMSGVVPKRVGNRSPGSAPAQVFKCADGEINFQASADPKYQALCRLLDRPDLGSDPRFQTRADRYRRLDVLGPELEKAVGKWKVAELYEALVAQGIVCSPIYSMDQTFADPQVQHRGLHLTLTDRHGQSVPTLANPFRFSEIPAQQHRPPPAIGEHTRAVLAGLLGYSDHDILEMIERGAIAGD